MNSIRVLFLTVFCLPVMVLQAAVITVDDDGSADYDRIQRAINAASAGDVIVVSPGRYEETVDLNENKAADITIQSTEPENPLVVLSTIIDAKKVSSAIECNERDGMSTLIRGFLIIKGDANYGGAINCDQSDLVVEYCTFADNYAYYHGGAIYGDESSITIRHCTFNGNSVYNGKGGAVYCKVNSQITIENCGFGFNVTEKGSGGAICSDNNSIAVVSDSTFVANSSVVNSGGAIEVTGSCTATISGCEFINNSADNYDGGAVHAHSSVVTIADSSFCSNVPDAYNGNADFIEEGTNYISEYCPPMPTPVMAGDLDEDGDVDLSDFCIFAENWLAGT